MSRVEDIFEVIEILFDIYYAIKNSETVPNRKISLPSDHNSTTNVFVINICNSPQEETISRCPYSRIRLLFILYTWTWLDMYLQK